ncbi:Rpn family recombination-promoting nuclease/putative transposase [Klebsiella pneumoniae]|nr:Rpn family recombination-promoting nuclease/putative transposase [Klebsiella pneumoniae]
MAKGTTSTPHDAVFKQFLTRPTPRAIFWRSI